jgi:hypothetical protein
MAQVKKNRVVVKSLHDSYKKSRRFADYNNLRICGPNFN